MGVIEVDVLDPLDLTPGHHILVAIGLQAVTILDFGPRDLVVDSRPVSHGRHDAAVAEIELAPESSEATLAKKMLASIQ